MKNDLKHQQKFCHQVKLCPGTMNSSDGKSFLELDGLLKDFSMPSFCIFPKNILTKCFHLDLVSTGFGVYHVSITSRLGI